jgi:hypothetical protein
MAIAAAPDGSERLQASKILFIGNDAGAYPGDL